MRVLVLNYEFPPVGGGGGRVSYDIGRGLVECEHQVAVVTARAPGLAEKENIDGMAIHRVSCLRQSPDRCSVPEMGAFVVAAIPAAYRIARQFKPDVVHAHFAVPTGAVAFALKRLTGLPYILTAHLGDVPGGVPDQTDKIFRLINPMVRPIWRHASAVSAVSSFVADLAEKAYRQNVTVINNGVILPKSEPDYSVGSPPRMVFVGRFNPQKNLPFFMNVLADLKDCPWSLDMIGNGPDYAEVEALVSRHGLRDRIRFHGWQDDSAVDDFLSAADILTMPSLSEGFPVVAARALGQGLAIYGADIAGLADIVVDGINGVLVQPDNKDSCVTGMRRLLADQKKIETMRRASRQRANQFELAGIVHKYEDLLEGVVRCG